MKVTALLLALGLAITVTGCSNDEEGSCERIVEACHEKDTGTGKPHECHEMAESSGDDAACYEDEDDCLAACQ